MKEMVVDLFAGGGGASEGIRMALGRDPDVAINHDLVAIAMHTANHPGSVHYHEDIWKVPPKHATQGRRVGLLWASPDCKHFSRAKGGPPRRDREIRALAWVVVKWAQQVRPRVIVLENVEEFITWGPLDADGRIVTDQKGFTFKTFIWQLQRYGYQVEYKCLRACDYGAPTIRKRLFLIARCDGMPIVWPEATHGPERDRPYRTAAEIIDWSIPCPSIFERKRPLAGNTLKRIAEGIKRYVIEAAEPFILNLTHGGRLEPAAEPLRTITAAIVNPFLLSYYGPKHPGDFRGRSVALIAPHIQRQFGKSIGHGADMPVGTVTAGGGGKTALVTAFMAQHNGGFYDGPGRPIDGPLSTIVQRGTQQQLVTSHLLKLRGTCRDGQPITEPVPTITSGGLHVGEVRAFLLKYYGTKQDPNLREPLHTITTKDRFGLITVHIASQPYLIADIGMRMLSPRELFRAQGFDDSYEIDIEVNGKKITKADQVRMCGNSVCPPIAAALVRANVKTRRAGKRSGSSIDGNGGIGRRQANAGLMV